jgi:hypothetical protein
MQPFPDANPVGGCMPGGTLLAEFLLPPLLGLGLLQAHTLPEVSLAFADGRHIRRRVSIRSGVLRHRLS